MSSSAQKTDNYKAIDAVVNIWTDEALSKRPGWGTDFFSGKMKADRDVVSKGISLEQMIGMLDEAGIERAFLVAAHSGRPGLPGCYHMPYEVVARACEKYPQRFSGLAGIDPFDGMRGVKAFEDAVKNMGFIGAHLYPHWFELAPDHAKYYPFYAKCWELGVPIQMQVGQSMIYAKDFPCRSVGRPITLDQVACDFPGLKLIGIHVGIPWTDEMISMCWKHENVYMAGDAYAPKYWPPQFVHYANSYGREKVMFGTDWPVIDPERAVTEVKGLNLREDSLRLLMRDNALRVFKLT